MCAAGHVGFLPENTHLMYLNFPCMPLLSTLQYNPHQIYETKTLTPFGTQPARQKSQAFQVVPVQRRPEDRCRCLFDVIYKHITMSINIQSRVSLTTADIKQMREKFSCSGWLLWCNIHPHLFFLSVLVLGLVILRGRDFPFPYTVPGYHHRWQTSWGTPALLLFKFQIPILVICLSFFRESPCSFCAGAQMLSLDVQNRKISPNAAVLRQSHWVGSHMTGWTAI